MKPDLSANMRRRSAAKTAAMQKAKILKLATSVAGEADPVLLSRIATRMRPSLLRRMNCGEQHGTEQQHAIDEIQDDLGAVRWMSQPLSVRRSVMPLTPPGKPC